MGRIGVLLAVAIALAGACGAARADIGSVPAGSMGHITLPSDGDDYSKLVAEAVAHDPSMDFRALRFAWLKSAARKRAGDTDDLRKALFAAVKAGDDQGVRDAAEKLVSAQYTDLYGQKFLRQACEKLHDDVCAQQGHYVEFGLLNSITHSGDGKTCPTGWEVAEVKEEYFVLAMLGMTPSMQSLIGGAPSCDRMDVHDQQGQTQTFYFRIDAVLEDERSMLGLPQEK
jgi:hypothetical protein